MNIDHRIYLASAIAAVGLGSLLAAARFYAVADDSTTFAISAASAAAPAENPRGVNGVVLRKVGEGGTRLMLATGGMGLRSRQPASQQADARLALAH